MSQTRQNSECNIHPLIAGRWSPRTFDGNRAVETEKIAACLEAARWSSSCFGDEPWCFIVADKSSNADGWQQMLDVLVDANQQWAQHAPVLILACAAQNFAKNGKVNRWGQYDTGQAMMSFALQAVGEGLISHSMGGFDAEAVKAAPDDVTPMSVTALGYSGDLSLLSQPYQDIETAARIRKPVREFAFTRWGEAWSEQV